mmetsp:Transcript_36713/g.117975  ORF Transcript_36713/g.117975 Transcript_36713/m.117975 type:complete len:233 (-) Transcript_36713:93-791(-)
MPGAKQPKLFPRTPCGRRRLRPRPCQPLGTQTKRRPLRRYSGFRCLNRLTPRLQTRARLDETGASRRHTGRRRRNRRLGRIQLRLGRRQLDPQRRHAHRLRITTPRRLPLCLRRARNSLFHRPLQRRCRRRHVHFVGAQLRRLRPQPDVLSSQSRRLCRLHRRRGRRLATQSTQPSLPPLPCLPHCGNGGGRRPVARQRQRSPPPLYLRLGRRHRRHGHIEPAARLGGLHLA